MKYILKGMQAYFNTGMKNRFIWNLHQEDAKHKAYEPLIIDKFTKESNCSQRKRNAVFGIFLQRLFIRSLLIVLLALFAGAIAFTQQQTKLYIDNPNFKILQGTELYINGSLEVDEGANIDNGGEITLTDSLINHTDGLFMPSSYGKMDNVEDTIVPAINIGQVSFTSDSVQIVSNSGLIIFDSINISATDSVIFIDSVRLVGEVVFNRGYLKIGNNGLFLYYEHDRGDARRTGTLSPELVNSRIVDITGKGFVEAEKELITGGSDRFNSIGIAPHCETGVTRIKRYHYHDTAVTDTSIAKVYEVVAVEAGGHTYDTWFKYLDPTDIPKSTNEEDLVVWNYKPTSPSDITSFYLHPAFKTKYPNIYINIDEEQQLDINNDTILAKATIKDGYRFTLAEKNCDTLPPANLGPDTAYCTGTTAKLKAFNDTRGWENYLYKWGSDIEIGGDPNRLNVYEYTFNTDSVKSDTSFKVWVKVRDYRGCAATDTVNMIVHASTPVGLKIYEPDMTPSLFSVCQGAPFVIVDTNNTDTTQQNYTWWFEDDTLANNNSIVKYALDIPGDTIKFGVKYVNDYGCVSYKNTGITVNPLPAVRIEAEYPICEGTYAGIQNLSTIPPRNPVSSTTLYRWKIGSLDQVDVVPNAITSVNNTDFISEELNTSNLSPDLKYNFAQPGWNTLSLTAISNANCVSSDSIEVFVNPAVSASFTPDSKSVVCKGLESVLYPDANCSVVPETNYSWLVNPALPWINSDTVKHLYTGTGSYDVTLAVVSDSGCADTVVHAVTIHPNAKAAFEVENHCLDSTTFVKNKSESANSYFWDFGDGITSTNFEYSRKYSSADTFNIKLVANNQWNCKDSITKPVVVYPLPDVGFNIPPVICINEQDSWISNTSASGLSYYWTFGDGSFSVVNSPQKEYASEGSYFINLKGTDNNGCNSTTTKKVEVYGRVPGAFDPLAASVCQGNVSVFNPGGSTMNLDSIQWIYGDGADTVLSKNTPSTDHVYSNSGFYLASMVTISQNGCRDTTNSEIIIYPNPEINIVTEGQNCAGSEIVMRLANGTPVSEIARYTWNFGDASLSTLPVPGHFYTTQGNYTVSLEAVTQQGCLGYDTLQVNIEALPQIPFGERYTSCEASLELIAGPSAYNYLWHNGSTDSSIVVTQSGMNSVTVTNPLTGCEIRQETKVLLLEQVNPGLAENAEACGHMALNAYYPGGKYRWSTGDTTPILQVTQSGIYSVEVKDINNCTGYDTINVTINDSPVIHLPDVISFCQGESGLLNPGVAKGTFEWSTGAVTPTIDVEQPGYYWVKNTNDEGCSNQALTNVIFNPLPVVNLGNDISVCEDKTVTLNAGNPGSTYLWNNAGLTQTINPVQSGVYFVNVTNTYGCNNADTIQVTINPLPQISLGGNRAICEGQEIELDAGTATSYYWSTYEETSTVRISQPGDYWVRITDNKGCTNLSDIVTLKVNEKPVKPFASDYIEECEFAILDAQNPGATYLWQSGDQQRNFYTNQDGTYWVDITNAANCSVSDTVEVRIKPQADVNLPDMLEICSNNHEFINAGYFGEEYNYNWNTGSTEQFIKVSVPGWYKVNVTHSEGCAAKDSTYVVTKPAPVIELPKGAIMCAHSGLRLDAGNPGSLYSWQNSNGKSYGHQVWEIDSAGTYWVYVMSPNGCSNSDTTEIQATSMSIKPHFMVASQLRVGDTVRFVDLSQPEPDGYLWEFGDLITSTEREPTHIYLVENTYDVKLEVNNEVCSSTIIKPLTVEGFNPYYLMKMGLDKQNGQSGIIRILSGIVYPNPVSEFATLKLSISEPEKVVFYLYNIKGQILKTGKFEGVQEIETPIDVSGLSQGMYFIRVMTRNEAKTYKLLKVE